jgi:CubicO group peptidase (beta-lactamase class C family)
MRCFLRLALICLPLLGIGQTRLESVVGRIDARLQMAEQQDGFSGVVYVGKGDRILLNRGYGWSDPVLGLKNNQDKRFMIASVSKSFVAAAILQLQEKGLLDIHDPLCKYLPEYPSPASQAITIHHLLSHTSGIPDYINDYPIRFRMKQMAGWVPGKDELIASFQDRPLSFAPGERFKYSNSGYVLLARIVEKVSGKDYHRYLQENIFDPLGMEDTGMGDFDIVNNRAVAYKGRGKHKKPIANFKKEWIYGMGEMYSTASDLNRWLGSFSDTLVLSQDSKAKMFSPEKNNYGYGWHVYDVFGHMQFSHGGYLPGWNSYVFYYPEDTLSVIVLSNVEHANPLDMCGNISRILYANKINEPEYFTDRKLIGRYEVMGDGEGGTAQEERPFEADIVTVNELEGSIAVKTPGGETIRFQRMNTGEWQDQQNQMRLQFKETGGSVLLQVTKNGKSWKWQKLSGDYQPEGPR